MPPEYLLLWWQGIAAPVPEKRTTGRLMACKRYSGEVFTAHGPLMASIQNFRTCYASCL